MRYTGEVGSRAHVELLQRCRPCMMEYQLESLFLHHIYYHGGCRHAPYTSIIASGPNAAILHYGSAEAPNGALSCRLLLALFDTKNCGSRSHIPISLQERRPLCRVVACREGFGLRLTCMHCATHRHHSWQPRKVVRCKDNKGSVATRW
jgi:Metallopeptidase family M24